ncbi:MAG: hypothetical protein ACYTFY_21450 [Planctomycetota bacterium]|jgi:hypothetical protein
MFTKKSLLTVLILLSLTITATAGKKKSRKKKKATKPVVYAPAGKVIAITAWKLQKTRLNGINAFKGEIVVQNKGKKDIESLSFAIELQDENAFSIKKTEWFKLTSALTPLKKTKKKKFRINGVTEFGTLVLYVRYFPVAESSGEDKTTKLSEVKKTLTGEFGTSSLESIDEMFFSLSFKKPTRYSEESLKKAVEEYNEKHAPKTTETVAEEGGQKIKVTNIDLFQPDANKSETDLILSVINSDKEIAAGKLQLTVIFKDANGNELNKFEHTCERAVPAGKSEVTIEKKILKDGAQSWEYMYKYF